MVAYNQELPPKGGYEPIEWAKRVPRKSIGGFGQFAIFAGLTTLGWVWYAFKKKQWREEDIEIKDARFAVEPFLMAERQRAFLKHLRKNRDEENELMKNVKGWETGTLWGEPVYHNVRDRFKRASLEELITHMSDKDKRNFIYDKVFR